MKSCRKILSSAKFKAVANGEELIRGRLFLPQAFPAPHVIEERLERIHQNTNNSNTHDWPAEVRGLYRDILKGIPIMYRPYRVGIPESNLRKTIRKLFEEGPKLTDPAAIRLKVIKASAEVEEFFQVYMQDNHLLKYSNLDPNGTLQKDIERSAGPTQSAYRFFNEGKNVLMEPALSTHDITENKVFITREEAYRKGLAGLSPASLLSHYSPALDAANSATLEVVKSSENVNSLFNAAYAAAKIPVNEAEDYTRRFAQFCKLSDLPHNKPIGETFKKAWETYRNVAFNAAVITHSAYKSLVKDPTRNFLARGAADDVRLGTPENNLSKIVAHLYYSDQLPDSWSEDLNISYLADLKGIDRRLDLLLDEEIAFRSEQVVRISIHTIESIKATFPHAKPLQEARSAILKGATVSVDGLPCAADIQSALKNSDLLGRISAFDEIYASLLTKHLNEFAWENFTINSILASSTCEPILDVVNYRK